MHSSAIRARKPSACPTVRYSGVLCLNPDCGAPMDVIGVWPESIGEGGVPVPLYIIQTLECPYCEEHSTYCPEDVKPFQGLSLPMPPEQGVARL